MPGKPAARIAPEAPVRLTGMSASEPDTPDGHAVRDARRAGFREANAWIGTWLARQQPGSSHRKSRKVIREVLLHAGKEPAVIGADAIDGYPAMLATGSHAYSLVPHAAVRSFPWFIALRDSSPPVSIDPATEDPSR